MSPGIEVVRGEELEHEEQEVNGERDQHGLVLGVLLGSSKVRNKRVK